MSIRGQQLHETKDDLIDALRARVAELEAAEKGAADMSKTLVKLKAEWGAVDTEFAALDEVRQETEKRWSIAWDRYQTALRQGGAT